jgi:hypothetical protein
MPIVRPRAVGIYKREASSTRVNDADVPESCGAVLARLDGSPCTRRDRLSDDDDFNIAIHGDKLDLAAHRIATGWLLVVVSIASYHRR